MTVKEQIEQIPVIDDSKFGSLRQRLQPGATIT